MALVLEDPTGQAEAGTPASHVPDFDDSFAQLFAVAYRVAFRILGQREEADDVAEAALAKAWLRWDQIAGYAPAWVARASANAAISQIRRRRLLERLPLVVPMGTSTPVELRDELVRALRRLPRRQREVLVLRYLADLPLHDVAAALGCSVGTVKSHAHRALHALRSDSLLDSEEL